MKLSRSSVVRLARSTEAFRFRNYQLFFMGQSVTLIGNWMQQLALGWLILNLGGSATALGLLIALTQVPTIILGPIAGVIADRYEKRSLLRMIQLFAASHALVLAILTLSGWIEPWMVFSLALFMGCVNAFEMTTRQSFVVEMVDDKRALPNAITLNSLMFNSARAIGPAIGGQVVAFFGEGICFLLNAISYGASNFALRAMKLPVFQRVDTVQRNVSHELIEGFKYIRSTLPIFYSLCMLTAVSVFASQQMVVLPILARDFLAGGSGILGVLMMAFGLGAVINAIRSAFLGKVWGSEKVISRGCFIAGIAQVLLVVYPNIYWAFFLNAMIGYGAIAAIVSTNTILQLLAEPHMRGRVLSFYSICLMGLGPLGGFLFGRIIDWQGVVPTLSFLGVCCIIASFIYNRYAASVVRNGLEPLVKHPKF